MGMSIRLAAVSESQVPEGLLLLLLLISMAAGF